MRSLNKLLSLYDIILRDNNKQNLYMMIVPEKALSLIIFNRPENNILLFIFVVQVVESMLSGYFSDESTL